MKLQSITRTIVFLALIVIVSSQAANYKPPIDNYYGLLYTPYTMAIKISAVIPGYNEEKSLPETLTRLNKVVDEVIYVDNGSTDSSMEIAKSYGAIVILEPRKQNGIGYGYALITGLLNSSGRYVVTVDADGEHEIEKIPQIVAYAQSNSIDFINCSRTTRETSKINSLIRKFGVNILNIEARILFGLPTKDILSGMWCINRNILSKLSINEGGWNLSPEIKLSAYVNKNVTYFEFPIHGTVRKEGKSQQILWKTALEHATFILWYRIATVEYEIRYFVQNFTKSFTYYIK